MKLPNSWLASLLRKTVLENMFKFAQSGQWSVAAKNIFDEIDFVLNLELEDQC